MTRSKKSNDFIVPIISILFAVASFFTGRYYENQIYTKDYDALNFENEQLKKERDSFRKKIKFLTDEDQRNLQLKYIDLLSENLEKARLFKADLLIHLIEDPEVRLKYSNYTQSLVRSDIKDKKNIESIELKGRFANTSYESRKEIERTNDNIIKIAKSKHNDANLSLTASDSLALEKFDKIEQEKLETKYNVYTEFISTLESLTKWYVLNNMQIEDYLGFHAKILEQYANDELRMKMNELFEVTKNGLIEKQTKESIEEVTEILNNELNNKLWCKAGSYILWKNIKCSVVKVLPSENKVILNLIDTENNKTIRDNIELKEKENIKIEELHATLVLTKIDYAGKNFLNKAGYFKLTD